MIPQSVTPYNGYKNETVDCLNAYITSYLGNIIVILRASKRITVFIHICRIR